MNEKKLAIYFLIVVGVILATYTSVMYLQYRDLDCIDFATQKEAQETFKKWPFDKYSLDANHNGIACESLP